MSYILDLASVMLKKILALQRDEPPGTRTLSDPSGKSCDPIIEAFDGTIAGMA